jgi:hypothetical protein
MLVSIDCIVNVFWVLEIMTDHDCSCELEALLCCCSTVDAGRGREMLLKDEKKVASSYLSHLVRLQMGSRASLMCQSVD